MVKVLKKIHGLLLKLAKVLARINTFVLRFFLFTLFCSPCLCFTGSWGGPRTKARVGIASILFRRTISVNSTSPHDASMIDCSSPRLHLGAMKHPPR